MFEALECKYLIIFVVERLGTKCNYYNLKKWIPKSNTLKPWSLYIDWTKPRTPPQRAHSSFGMIVVHDWSGALLVTFSLSLSPGRQASRPAGRRFRPEFISFAVPPRPACLRCVDSVAHSSEDDFHTIRQSANFATIDQKAARGSRESRYPDNARVSVLENSAKENTLGRWRGAPTSSSCESDKYWRNQCS